MIYKWLGAGMIISCCTGCGFSIVLHQKSEIKMLQELRHFLDEILCELPYKLTPLPQLIRSASSGLSGRMKQMLDAFAVQLDRQVLPDASCCMNSALDDYEIDSEKILRLLKQLGNSLGRFDLGGQLKELTGLQAECQTALSDMEQENDIRFRSYRVLGLCAGIALTILLI